MVHSHILIKSTHSSFNKATVMLIFHTCLPATENGNKPRRKATTPGASPKSAVGGGRRVSAPPQFPNAG